MGVHSRRTSQIFFYRRRLHQRVNDELEPFFAVAKNTAEAAEEDWDSKTEAQKGVAATIEYYLAIGYEMDTVPVEFVRYDEEFYQYLVDNDCVNVRNGVPGQVSLELESLHQYI